VTAVWASVSGQGWSEVELVVTWKGGGGVWFGQGGASVQIRRAGSQVWVEVLSGGREGIWYGQ
jgi:hypothetical protein